MYMEPFFPEGYQRTIASWGKNTPKCKILCISCKDLWKKKIGKQFLCMHKISLGVYAKQYCLWEGKIGFWLAWMGGKIFTVKHFTSLNLWTI